MNNDSEMEAFVWNTRASLEANLKAVHKFLYRMEQRDTKCSNDDGFIVHLAEQFLDELTTLAAKTDKKLGAYLDKLTIKQPIKCNRQKLVETFVAFFKKRDNDAYQENLELFKLEEKKLLEEVNFLKWFHNFLNCCPIRLRVAVDFENFETHDIYETEVGSFLLVSAHGDWECEVFFVIYFSEDGKFCTYVPSNGNQWDKKSYCALNEDDYSDGLAYDKEAMIKEVVGLFTGEKHV